MPQSSRHAGWLTVTVVLATLPLQVVPGSTAGSGVAFVVNTDDDGRDDGCDARHCTLREAIRAANARPRGAVIRFRLPASAHRIELRSALPALRNGVTIDGSSQPGATCPRPTVQVDGSALPAGTPVNGFEIRGDRNHVRGLSVTGFSGHGVLVDGSENRLQCLFVGVEPDGHSARGNAGHGIAVVGGHSNRVGGPATPDGNLLSANAGDGLHVEDAINTYIANNGIGIDFSGDPRLANGNAELPRINPPPGWPSELHPRAIEALAAMASKRTRAITERSRRAIEDSGLYDKYRRLLAKRDNRSPPPADLSELAVALLRHPELYSAFIAEMSVVAETARADAAVQHDRVTRTVQRVLPGFGRNTPLPAQGQFDVLSHTLAAYRPGDYVTSGSPSQIVAIDDTIAPPPASALYWRSLTTWGPASLDQPSDTPTFGWAVNPYPDPAAPFPGASFLQHVCISVVDLPVAPACQFPVAYDLLPFSIQLLWQSSTLTQQEIEAIVLEDGYALEVRVNGQKLFGGPPPWQSAGGFLLPNETLPGQGYYAASMPGGPSPHGCPTGRNCLATGILAHTALANVPKPWTFEIRVEKRELLPVPIVIGVDELGNQVIATHFDKQIAQAARVVVANPDTGGETWFEAALLRSFKHPRCSTCHSFETRENLAKHHVGNALEAWLGFIYSTNMQLHPSLYVPGAKVMTCDNCHTPILAQQDSNGVPFVELEWRAPHYSLDVNWSEKTAAEICARVKANLPTWHLRHEHFHGDSRLFWAITDGSVPGGGDKGTAPPHDWDEFLRRVDLWNDFGTPCP